MATLNEIIARAEALRKESYVNSIDPERVGSIMSDTLKYLNEFQLQSGSMGLDKIYASVSAMNSDNAPVSDLTGKPLKAGQLAVIVASGEEDEDNGKVYRFDNPGWTYVSIIGNLNIVQKTGNSETAVMSQKAVTDYLNAGYLYKGIANPSTDPGTPDQNVFYIAFLPGQYTGFGSTEIKDGQIGLFTWAGEWTYDVYSSIYDKLNLGFSPYFGDDKTFALDSPTAAYAIRCSLLKCRFNEPVPTRIGIYAYQIGPADDLVIHFSDCDSLGDDDIIPSSAYLGGINVNISGQLVGQNEYPIKNGDVVIGSAIIDIGMLRRASGHWVLSSTPTTFANSGFYRIETNAIDNQIAHLGKELEPVRELGWGAKLMGNVNSILTARQTISLQNNGDSLEIAFDGINSLSMNHGGYAFTKTTASTVSVRGIFVSKNDGLRVRFDDGTWFDNAVPFTEKSTLKIEYVNGNVELSVDNSVVSTYVGQKPLTIVSFGNGVNEQYTEYWSGIIKSIKYNGAELSLADAFIWGSDAQLGRTAGFLSDQQAEQLANAINYEMLYAQKTATRLSMYQHLYNDIYIMYPLNYRQAEYVQDAYPSYYDNWGIGRPALCKFDGQTMQELGDLFHGAEAELAIRLPRANGEDFVYVGGSAHGFENIVVGDNGRHFTMLIDNSRVAETDVFALKPIVSVQVIQESQLVQAYSNSNPFATATKKWSFDQNGLEITTSVEILRSLQFNAAQFGMLGALRHWGGLASNNYLTNKAIKNNKVYKVYDISDNWESDPNNLPLKAKDKECTKIVAYGERNIGFSLEIRDATTKPNGGMFIDTNGGQPYNKIYFDLTGSYTPSVDEVLKATQKWEIE